MLGNNESAIDVLAEQIKDRNNPTDLKVVGQALPDNSRILKNSGK